MALSGSAPYTFLGKIPNSRARSTGPSSALGYETDASALDLPSLGLAFIRASNSADVFTKMSRYEATIRAGFYRAYDELQCLRAARGVDAPEGAGGTRRGS